LPVLFSTDVGMIVSPAAVQKAGANFNTAPGDAGAGPFVIASYKPGEELLLRRNDSYWGGTPYLDQVRFVLIGKGDPSLMYDALKVNTVQAFLTRNPQVVTDAKNNKLLAIDSIVPAGNLLNMNVGVVVCKGGLPAGACAGKADGEKSLLKTATSDIRVRRAVAAAVDPNVVNARMYDGQGLPGTEVFPKPCPGSPSVPGAKYDDTEATRLVTEAKGAGWDGKIRVLSSSTPTSSAEGLAVTAMLQAAGMEVQYQNDKDTAGVVAQVITARDFDVVVNWAIGTDFNADNTFASLYNTFYKDTLRYGYGSPDMDAGLDALRMATTDDQRTAAFKKIAEVWVRDQPAAVVAAVPSSWIASAKVHGLTPNSSDVVLLDKAWLQP
jgi:peptide/nickel transport system substrate-binding protein